MLSPAPIRTAFIGLGKRGLEAVERFTHLDEAVIAAVCDIDQESVSRALTICRKGQVPTPSAYCGPDAWERLCEDPDIDLVYICTPWHTHAQIAVRAMSCGKHAAVEVPAAMTVRECWELVETAERTGKQCMMLENCIYDEFELTVQNMASKGLFGEIVHCEGGYMHQIDEGREKWRNEYNRQHRGDLYPTHGLGPVARILGINHGDRMESLVSVDTGVFKGAGVNGDQTSTIIRTALGKTILLQHNVVTPRPYSRGFQVVGTEGYVCKYPVAQIQIGGGVSNSEDPNGNVLSEAASADLLEKHRHPFVQEDVLLERAKGIGRHGGMDFIMDWRLVHCLRNGLALDMDVYDAAAWSSIIELSEKSIADGSTPVSIPDFTRGGWRS